MPREVVRRIEKNECWRRGEKVKVGIFVASLFWGKVLVGCKMIGDRRKVCVSCENCQAILPSALLASSLFLLEGGLEHEQVKGPSAHNCLLCVNCSAGKMEAGKLRTFVACFFAVLVAGWCEGMQLGNWQETQMEEARGDRGLVQMYNSAFLFGSIAHCTIKHPHK